MKRKLEKLNLEKFANFEIEKPQNVSGGVASTQTQDTSVGTVTYVTPGTDYLTQHDYIMDPPVYT